MTLSQTVRSRATRAIAAGGLAVIGAILAVPNVLTLVRGETALGMGIAAIGLLLALVVGGASVVLYRTDITTPHVARITGWNVLGFVVLGTVMLLSRAYLQFTPPLFVVTTILGVSAFAHLVIGVNDVRRIRATALAREREKLAVVNRLLRHNLAHDAQLLYGYAELAENDLVERRVIEVADRLADLDDKADGIQALLDREDTDRTTIDLAAAVREVVATFEEDHPEVTFEIECPETLVVQGDGYLVDSVTELVENAVEHNDSADPVVRIRAEASRRDVTITVSDNGSGIPEPERAIVDRSRPITQLDHASGLGLWFTKWVAETNGGGLSFDDERPSAVSLRLPRGRGQNAPGVTAPGAD
ncbi:sensor histidine kinase [Natronomonas sp. EA1]|uniref:sensor histidine kinase n=1 Tax=Natronomonas sp. EA1 TaxID=3421655 RepID=UPI003EC02A72